MKAYNRKSDARRAAIRELTKAENMTVEEVKAAEGTLFTVEEHPEIDGKYFWRRVQVGDILISPPSQNEVFPPVVSGDEQQGCVDTSAESMFDDEPVSDFHAVVAQEVAPEEQALENVDAAAADNMTADGVLRKSVVDNPCRFVWDMADAMFSEGAKRKDIIAACVAAGVATYTARTQYQKWFAAHKSDQERAAKQQESVGIRGRMAPPLSRSSLCMLIHRLLYYWIIRSRRLILHTGSVACLKQTTKYR